jgi:hypothetical protein
MGSSIAEVSLMFGPNSMKKALCGCGELVDLDTDTVIRKKLLGKRVECVNCRNRRIAVEKESMERHFLGLEEESTAWTTI